MTICSVNASLPDPAVLDYSAAKAALAAFCKALSKEVGPRGVRVNTVSPGPVATDLWLGDHGVAQTVSRATGAKPEDVANQAAHDSVTGRFSRPEEVADLVLLLASDRTANVTGADFRIDGGLIPHLVSAGPPRHAHRDRGRRGYRLGDGTARSCAPIRSESRPSSRRRPSCSR